MPGYSKPRKQLLNHFVKLWKAPAPKIISFAKTNGVLSEHSCATEGREALGRWREMSRAACAFLNIGAEANSGKKPISTAEWEFIWPDFSSISEYDLEGLADRNLALDALRYFVNQWLSHVRLSLGYRSYYPPEFALEVNYRLSMLNAVAVQVALTLAKADSLYICSGCAFPYARSCDKRRPKPGQANFCDTCYAAGIPLRQADIRRRLKMAEAHRLHAEGVPLKEIAQRIEANQRSVRRWVKKGK